MKPVNNTVHHPKVSIIMPVFNAAGYLPAALDSIGKQTYTNWELIVVNDCSTDNSAEIVRAFKKQHPRKVKLIDLNTNLNTGGDTATNMGIPHAKGELIAKMDADDIAHPKRLEKQVAYLREHPEIDVLGTNATVINTHGTVIGEKTVPLTHEEIYQEYIYFHPMIHPTLMFRRKLIKRNSFYKIKYPLANDYYTLFRLICRGHKFANLPDKLLYYRIYGANSSLKNIKKGVLSAMYVKWDMIRNHNYPVTAMVVLKNLIQAAVAFTLPQRVSFYLYLISKGIMKTDEIFGSAVDQARFHFRQLKQRLHIALK